MSALETKLKQAEEKNRELAARLQLREQINGAVVSQLEAQNRERQQEVERLQGQLQRRDTELQRKDVELQRLQEKERHYTELNTLLKEELAWFKAQMLGRSSEKSRSEAPPEQGMLFNEPEVLMAISQASLMSPKRSSPSKSTSGARSRARKRSRRASPASSRLLISPSRRNSALTMARP